MFVNRDVGKTNDDVGEHNDDVEQHYNFFLAWDDHGAFDNP